MQVYRNSLAIKITFVNVTSLTFLFTRGDHVQYKPVVRSYHATLPSVEQNMQGSNNDGTVQQTDNIFIVAPRILQNHFNYHTN